MAIARGIVWTVGPFVSTSFRTYFDSPWPFEETVARIVAASGQPAESDDDYKTSVNFEGTWNGARFTLYDYKEDRRIHIGGADRLRDLSGLVEALTAVLSAVEPQPYSAEEYYDEKRGHAFPPSGDR